MKKTLIPFLTITCLLFFQSLTITAQTKGKLTLENIWYSNKYSANYPSSFKGLADGKSYSLAEKKDKHTVVNRYDIATGKKLSELFSTEKIVLNTPMSSFDFDQAEKMVVIKTNINAIYRHSYTCDATIYSLSNKVVLNTFTNVMYPTFSPDGNFLAYVQENNLFVYDLTKKKTCQVTKDGAKNKIINGAVDWVYEEEFGMDVGFFWSPDSKNLAYYKFDESQVKEYSMDLYGTLYPTKEVWKYPKAGEQNSKVYAYIFNTKKQKSKQCETNSENDQYLPRMAWDISGSYLTVQRINRHQNKLDILKVDPASGKASILYNESNPFYIEVSDWYCTPEGFWIHLSEKQGFNQLWQLNPNTKEDKVLTLEKYDIDNFYGYDINSNKAFFNAGKDITTERQIFSINTLTQELKQLSSENGWHSATFIAGMQFYLDYYSTASNPGAHTLYNTKGEKIRVIADNERLTAELAELELGTQSFGKISNRYGDSLDYWMLQPANFDKAKQYPILFYVYGGPGYQTAKNSYGGGNYLWHEYMAQQGYVIITVNNTGSGSQGEAFKKKTYLQLGNYETQDYIDAAKYFGNQSWANKSRIGIWGWSYGGYMSSNCITRGADYFKTAVAVAPVTSWRYYDNIYTERYMRTPQENALGYDTNSPINHVEKLRGNYLLVHGTGDDNVHFQNAAEMMLSLNNANIPYDCAIYPNKSHGISGGKTRLHLFTKITKFFLENL